MSSPKNIFIEEANELIALLESALLELDKDRSEKSYVEEIFRVMHTLKGNSSMFGYVHIAELVHNLENIYDNIRSNRIVICNEIINITFSALDHLKVIIKDEQLLGDTVKEYHQQLLQQINLFVNDSAGHKKSNDKTEIESNDKNTFYILFKPDKSILFSGNDPLLVIKDLMNLGATKIVPHFDDVKSFGDISPLNCYAYWEIFIETKADEEEIKSCFLFVEDLSTIEIKKINEVQVLKNIEFLEYVSKFSFTDSLIDFDYLNNVFYNDGNKTELKQFAIDNQTEKKQLAVDRNKPGEKISSSIRVGSDKLDELMNLVSELVTTQASLTLYAEINKNPELITIAENVEKLSRKLRDVAFGMTLIPINTMFGRFQRLVRDLAISLNKEINFITEGGDTELDKSIIDTLTDPIMHIIRNSVDHGIESPQDRINKGKSASGVVKLKAYYSGVYVYIQISDDGKGINPEMIRQKAISKGIIKEDDNLSYSEIYDLLFYPGFSTANVITDVSGRGVGMDVVKKNVSELKGTIHVSSEIEKGSVMTIRLPLTLSIIDGLLVTIDNLKFIIPLSVINKCYEVRSKLMENNFNRLIILDDKQVPFVDLRNHFNFSSPVPELSQVIVVNENNQLVGIAVDSIIGEYQAVIKPLGKYYRKQGFISGATILGDGSIALVLDAHHLIKNYKEKFNVIIENEYH